MSGPISATITSAAVAPRPAIVRRRAAAAANGAIAAAIRSSSRAHPVLGVLDPVQQQPQQEAMVLGDVAVQGRLQRGDLAPQPPPRPLGQSVGVVGPGDQRAEHGAARGAQHVAGDAGQLDVGPLQHLLDAVDHRDAVADQLRPLPGQLARRGSAAAA